MPNHWPNLVYYCWSWWNMSVVTVLTLWTKWITSLFFCEDDVEFPPLLLNNLSRNKLLVWSELQKSHDLLLRKYGSYVGCDIWTKKSTRLVYLASFRYLFIFSFMKPTCPCLQSLVPKHNKTVITVAEI